MKFLRRAVVKNKNRYIFNGGLFRKYRTETLKFGLRECAAKLNVSKTYLSFIEIDSYEVKVSDNFASRLMELVKT